MADIEQPESEEWMLVPEGWPYLPKSWLPRAWIRIPRANFRLQDVINYREMVAADG